MACQALSQHRALPGLPFPHRVGCAPRPESVDLKQEGDTDSCPLLVGEVRGDHSLQFCSHLPGGHSRASQLACCTCKVVKVRSRQRRPSRPSASSDTASLLTPGGCWECRVPGGLEAQEAECTGGWAPGSRPLLPGLARAALGLEQPPGMQSSRSHREANTGPPGRALV